MAVQQVGEEEGRGGARGIEGISSIKRLSASGKRKRRNEHALVPVAVPTKTNSSSLFAEKARACTECGKEFSSWKALFGHMRCHPEREWRGINPPQAVRQERERKLMLMMNNGSEYGGSSHAHHIKSHDTENAHGSRLHPPQEHTARNKANMARQVVTEAESESRESEEKVASHNLHYDDSDTESIEAAYINESINKTKNQHPINEQLVNLLDTREDKSKQGQVKVKEVNADYSLSDIKEQHDMAHCLVMLASARRPLLTKEDESTSSDNRDSISMSITTKPLESDMAMFPWEVPVLRRESYSTLFQETMLIEAATAPPIKQGTFECGTCNKVFRSHQALGGHRASHKKVKGCFARTNDVSTQESPNEDVITTEYSTKSDENNYNTKRVIVNMIKGTPEESNIAYKPENLVLEDECQWTNLVTKKSKASGGHQCSICSRVFSTGQALGGHKRCHWGTTGDSSTTKGGDQPFATIQTLNTNIDITAPQRTIPSATTPSTIIYQPLMPSKKSDLLDLNLPAPMEDDQMLEHPNCTNENTNYTLTQPVELGVSSSSIIPFDLRIAGELLTLVSGIEKTNTNNGGQQNKDRSLEVTGDYYSRTAHSINRHNFGRCIQCTFCSKILLSMEEWDDHKRSHNLSPLLSQFCRGEPTF